MNRLLINKDQVTSIIVRAKRISKRFIYYPEVRIVRPTFFERLLGNKVQLNPIGFYEVRMYTNSSQFDEVYCSASKIYEEQGDCYSVEQDKVYVKDCIIFKTSDGGQQVLYFDSSEEVSTFINNHFNERKYLDLTSYLK